MKIVPVLSGKGGVGKSLVAINTANVLKNMGYKVGLIDIDMSGPSALKYLHITGRDVAVKKGMLQPLIASGISYMSPALFFDSDDQPVLLKGKRRAQMVQQFLDKVQWDCDYIVLDCPPGSNDEINYLVGSRKKEIYGVIIVATPSDIAVTQIRKSLVLCQRLQVPILGIVENMAEFVCSNCHIKESLLSSGVDPVETAAKEFHLDIIARLPFVKNMEANPLYFSGIMQTPFGRLF